MRQHSTARQLSRGTGLGAILAACTSILFSSCTALMGDAATPWRVGSEYTMQTHLSLGGRNSDADTKLGKSSQVVGGIEVDWYDPNAVLGYEVGYFYAYETDVTYQEGYFGLRRTWVRDGLTPYVGAGVSRMNAEPDSPLLSNFDSWGGYVRGGAYWHLGPSFFSFGAPTVIGVDLRTVVGDHVSAVEGRVFLGFGTP